MSEPQTESHLKSAIESGLKIASRPKAEPWLKLPIDLLLAFIMLILSIPIAIPIALAIKLEDGGPVFYRQKRWGRKGTAFTIYKFRTMFVGSDDLFGIKQAEKNDARITRVGKILRAMGLDELPQIINILLGQMSFVGPRSLAIGEKVRDHSNRVVQYEIDPNFWQRLRVRPGLTGLATIYLPKDAPPRHKFRFDMHYVRAQSICLDLHLIFLSFWISFRGKWESRGKKL